MKDQGSSTTSHSVILSWPGGEQRFYSRAMMYGAKAERIARELVAKGGLSEKAQAAIADGFDTGFHVRAVALFELAATLEAGLA